MKLPAITKPCKECPFTKTCSKGWLGEKRVIEILDSESFTCHKTNEHNGGRKQCAGFMIIKEGNSAFEKLAKALKHELILTGKELVFDSEQDMIEHHKVN